VRFSLKKIAIHAAILFACTFGAAAPASAQSDILLRLRSGSPLGDRMRVDSAGGIVAQGVLGLGLMPATGPGYRFMWMPYFAALRAGSTDDGGAGAYWDFTNVGFFSWAGGNRTIGKGYASMVMGEDINLTGNYSTAFGSDHTVTGQFCFVAGDDSSCSLSYGHAVGFMANAAGIAAVSLGYRTTADADYSVALGHRASTNGHTGSFVWADASTTDSAQAAANHEFLARASGGFRFRTNATLTTGCNLPAGSGVFSCTSSKTLKENFIPVDAEGILLKIRDVPLNYWSMKGELNKPRHLGPFSEDFMAAFGLGSDDKAIGTQDIDGVNFAGIQALEKRTTELKESITELKEQVRVRDEKIADLEARLRRLETLIENAKD
jgi:trimeric autotransporter adhesin